MCFLIRSKNARMFPSERIIASCKIVVNFAWIELSYQADKIRFILENWFAVQDYVNWQGFIKFARYLKNLTVLGIKFTEIIQPCISVCYDNVLCATIALFWKQQKKQWIYKFSLPIYLNIVMILDLCGLLIRDDMYLWLAPFTPGGKHAITLTFVDSLRIAMIRIWVTYSQNVYCIT